MSFWPSATLTSAWPPIGAGPTPTVDLWRKLLYDDRLSGLDVDNADATIGWAGGTAGRQEFTSTAQTIAIQNPLLGSRRLWPVLDAGGTQLTTFQDMTLFEYLWVMENVPATNNSNLWAVMLLLASETPISADLIGGGFRMDPTDENVRQIVASLEQDGFNGTADNLEVIWGFIANRHINNANSRGASEGVYGYDAPPVAGWRSRLALQNAAGLQINQASDTPRIGIYSGMNSTGLADGWDSRIYYIAHTAGIGDPG